LRKREPHHFTHGRAAMLRNNRSRLIQDLSVLHAGWARSLAAQATQASVDVFDQAIALVQLALLQEVQQVNPAPR
jgi:hypothetical protein